MNGKKKTKKQVKPIEKVVINKEPPIEDKDMLLICSRTGIGQTEYGLIQGNSDI